MSTQPGVTSRPEASISRSAEPSNRAYLGDLAVLYRDVADERLAAVAVDDGSAFEQQGRTYRFSYLVAALVAARVAVDRDWIALRGCPRVPLTAFLARSSSQKVKA